MVLLLLAVPLLGGIIAVAYATDLCLTFGTPPPPPGQPNITVVLQDLPGNGKNINKELAKPNKCRVVPALFLDPNNNLNQGNVVANATVCTNSAGNLVKVTTNYFGGNLATEFPLTIPTTNANTDIVSFQPQLGSRFNIPTTAAICVPDPFPVP